MSFLMADSNGNRHRAHSPTTDCSILMSVTFIGPGRNIDIHVNVLWWGTSVGDHILVAALDS